MCSIFITVTPQVIAGSIILHHLVAISFDGMMTFGVYATYVETLRYFSLANITQVNHYQPKTTNQ